MDNEIGKTQKENRRETMSEWWKIKSEEKGTMLLIWLYFVFTRGYHLKSKNHFFFSFGRTVIVVWYSKDCLGIWNGCFKLLSESSMWVF